MHLHNFLRSLRVLLYVFAAMIPPFLRADSEGTLLSVKLQPRASSNEIANALGSELRIRVTAPPVDSAANEALVRFLAEVLDCPRSSVVMVRGQASRHKVIRLHGLTAEEAAARLGAS